MKTYRDRMRELAENPNDPRHGTKTGVNLCCKCKACTLKRYEMANERREREIEKAKEAAREAREREEQRKARVIASKPKPKRSAKPKQLKDVCTVPEFLKHLMGKPNIDNADGRCSWCGAPDATNKHHIVKRSQGKWVKDGREVSKPTVRLCGDGNLSGCHAKAHAGLLHFRFCEPGGKSQKEPVSWLGQGHWEGNEFDEPCDIQTAWATEEGWRRI